MTRFRVGVLVALVGSLAGFAGTANAANNAVYDATCGLCHQAGGAGLKGQFPRLAGRVDRMAADPDAREFLIQTVLHGMAGRMEVDGAPIVGVMPSFEALPDKDLASVLNYLVGLGGPAAKKVKPVTAAEVAAVRKEARLSASQVLARRAALVAVGKLQ
jgi:mono/diheme cytochrome c family protein